MTTTTIITPMEKALMYAYISYLFVVLPYKFCILLTHYLPSPWLPLAEADHDQNSIYFWHSKCSKPLLATCLDCLLPMLSAFFWIVGRNRPPHYCISALSLLSKPTHSVQIGKSRAYVMLFPVLVDRYHMLPQFELSFAIGCSS